MGEIRLVYCNHCKLVGSWDEVYAGPTSRRRSTDKIGPSEHYCPEHLAQFEAIAEAFNKWPGLEADDINRNL